MRAPSTGRRAVLVAAGMLLGGYALLLLANTARVAGGTDSSGYLSEARQMVRGRLVLPTRGLERLDLPDQYNAVFVPLGYVAAGERSRRPQYPPGLPLHMAALTLLLGRQQGPFLVVPLAAIIGLFLMYAVGRELGLPSSWAIAGAVILGLWPAYLWAALQPLSDVPAAAWGMAAVLAALRADRRPAWGLASGAAFAIGVLIRPTNALLLAPLAVALPPRLSSLVHFGLGLLPFAAFQAVFNLTVHGGLLASGYVDIDSEVLVWAFFAERFLHYGTWLVATLSPLIPAGWLLCLVPWGDGPRRSRRSPEGSPQRPAEGSPAAGPQQQAVGHRAAGQEGAVSQARRRRAIVAVWFVPFFLFYCLYLHYDAWWFLRFLVPAAPALIIGALAAARDRLDVPATAARRAMLGLCLAIVLSVEVAQVFALGVLRVDEAESVYPEAARMAQERVPQPAVVVARQMSGALDYYTDLVYVRWDMLERRQLADLRAHPALRDHLWFALLFAGEVDDARERLPGPWRRVRSHRNVELWVLRP